MPYSRRNCAVVSARVRRSPLHMCMALVPAVCRKGQNFPAQIRAAKIGSWPSSRRVHPAPALREQTGNGVKERVPPVGRFFLRHLHLVAVSPGDVMDLIALDGGHPLAAGVIVHALRAELFGQLVCRQGLLALSFFMVSSYSFMVRFISVSCTRLVIIMLTTPITTVETNNTPTVLSMAWTRVRAVRPFASSCSEPVRRFWLVWVRTARDRTLPNGCSALP